MDVQALPLPPARSVLECYDKCVCDFNFPSTRILMRPVYFSVVGCRRVLPLPFAKLTTIVNETIELRLFHSHYVFLPILTSCHQQPLSSSSHTQPLSHSAIVCHHILPRNLHTSLIRHVIPCICTADQYRQIGFSFCRLTNSLSRIRVPRKRANTSVEAASNAAPEIHAKLYD